ncbi:ATP-binding protein [Streptomyces sp. NPDC050617]|uniref:ATP-binding protein n=1 Tax=Streptomyces sp. NPDC050617 TaxID=3154628 RepID=UPI003444F9D9
MVVMESQQSDAAGARLVAAEFLASDCPWADRDAVMLVVSELVTNAIRHTSGWWRLCLRACQGRLVLEIDDSSTVQPVPRAPDLGGGGGLGWHMVQRLATCLEVDPHAAGKTVRATWLRPAGTGIPQPADGFREDGFREDGFRENGFRENSRDDGSRDDGFRDAEERAVQPLNQ